jgi:hypothetical protein
MKLWFGEHKGKELSEIPKSYLEWLLNDTAPDIGKLDPPHVVRDKREQWRDLISEVEDELDRRDNEEGDEDDDGDGFNAVRFK